MPGQLNQSGVPIGNDYVMPSSVIGQGAAQNTKTQDPAYFGYADGTDRWGGHSYSKSPIGAWAPVLRMFPGGTPDPGRTMNEPLYQSRPDGGEPPNNYWTGRGRGHDNKARTNHQEYVRGHEWDSTEPPGYNTGKRAAADSRRTPPAESRDTMHFSPHRYVYTRAFDQRMSHSLNGAHFSMADHRRTYPIYGMTPVVSRRNTYRADPAPWDTGIVDMPADSPYYTGGGEVLAPNNTVGHNRSFRLG